MEFPERRNAHDDAINGWFVGAFMPPESGLRKTNAVEIKWGVHPAGEARREWVIGEVRRTVSYLISGLFVVELRNTSTNTEERVTLHEQGQYVTWGPGVDHRWEALEDSTVLTVRTPSIQTY